MFKFEDVSLINVGQMMNFASLLCSGVSEVKEDPTTYLPHASSVIGQLASSFYYRYSEMPLRMLDQHKSFLRQSRASTATVANSAGVSFLALHLKLQVNVEDVLAVVTHEKGAAVFLKSSLHDRMIVLEVTNYPIPFRLL